ncbi:MAG: redoxin domain-containing protein [Acidobacteriota bacterium]
MRSTTVQGILRSVAVGVLLGLPAPAAGSDLAGERASVLSDVRPVSVASRTLIAGMAMEIRGGRLVVASVLPGSAAARAGVLPGDIVLILDDVSLVELDPDRLSPAAALEILRATASPEIRLVLGRGAGTRTLSLPRELSAEPPSGAASPPSIGSPAPSFSGRDLAGETVALDQFRGRPVLIDFWASWCAPCRDSAITVRRLAVEHGDRLAIIGVSVDEDRRAYEAFAHNNHLPGHQLHDGGWFGPIGSLFGIAGAGIPFAVVIDPEGRVAGMGPSVSAQEETIRRLLAAGGTKGDP